MTVVEDDGRRLVTYVPPGSVRKVPDPVNAPSDRRALILASLAEQPPGYRDLTWTTNRRLCIVRIGARHMVSCFWRDSDGEFLGWYVDLLAPIRRTPLGIASMDLILDIVVAPDLSRWRWKDRADFAQAAASGIFDSKLVAEVEGEAARCLESVARRDPPYCEPWPTWRPNASWPLPVLPAGWDIAT